MTIAATIKKYRNAGGIDRSLRTIIGFVLIYFGFVDTSFIGQGLLAILIGIMGILNILAAVSGVCPAYTLAGISTCRSNKEHGTRA